MVSSRWAAGGQLVSRRSANAAICSPLRAQAILAVYGVCVSDFVYNSELWYVRIVCCTYGLTLVVKWPKIWRTCQLPFPFLHRAYLDAIVAEGSFSIQTVLELTVSPSRERIISYCMRTGDVRDRWKRRGARRLWPAHMGSTWHPSIAHWLPTRCPPTADHCPLATDLSRLSQQN